jgi:hypothetical protein
VAHDESHLTSTQLADLCALADGTIDPRRREEIEGWVSSDPALQAAYRQQRRAVSALQKIRDDQAPLRLRAQVERERHRRRAPSHRGVRYGLVLAGSVAAVVVVLALALPAGTPGAPSISEAAALAQRGPEAPGPGPDPRFPGTRLTQTVQDVYFPNWAARLGWHAVGERRDRLGGRVAVTVYYAKGDRQVAYTILGKPVLPAPRAAIRQLGGFELRTFIARGRTIVTWRREGHTCVISASGVSDRVLQRLAAWR